MTNQNSENLTKGDIITFVALILMGVSVFLGAYFKTLGDMLVSAGIAVLLIVVMAVAVFLGAHAKTQDEDQGKWKVLMYSMVVVYLAALVPCYVCCSKFCDVQFGKDEIRENINDAYAGLDKMFTEFDVKCESRVNAYANKLETLLTTQEGKEKIAQLIGDKSTTANIVKNSDVDALVSAFKTRLFNGIENLRIEKTNLGNDIESNINDWNILKVPDIVKRIDESLKTCAEPLKNNYINVTNLLEDSVDELLVEPYLGNESLVDSFKKYKFSTLGLVITLILGIFGSISLIFGEKSTMVHAKDGEPNVISNNGGFRL